MTEKKSEGYDVIKGLCRQITDVAEKREKQYQAELQAVREENQHLLLMVERLTKEAMDPFRSCVTYDFVVSYIANRSEKNAGPLISMLRLCCHRTSSSSSVKTSSTSARRIVPAESMPRRIYSHESLPHRAFLIMQVATRAIWMQT